MISVVLYGRNDSHGYNLHRRAALSINCIAEVLTDPDDEIIFVDWNTTARFPVFPVAISDTLTLRARDRLRIIRVPPSIHSSDYAPRTSLPTVEPVARNVGLIRSNPKNRWFLSTNSDMIFLVPGGSLSDAVRHLDDGYYALPRYELPELFWEALPRSSPSEVFGRIARWKNFYTLESRVRSYDFNVFDAPGDFQLVPREAAMAIGGFNEQMVLGWHVDSNFAKRMNLYFGRSRSIEDSLEGYHANHTRSMTVHHGHTGSSNNLERFVWNVSRADWRSSSTDSIGLATLPLSEIRLEDNALAQYETMGLSTAGVVERDFASSKSMRSVPARLAMTGLLEVLHTLGPSARVLYIGDGELEGCLREMVRASFLASIRVAPITCPLNESYLRETEWIVVDFSLPGVAATDSLRDLSKDTREGLSGICMRLSEIVRVLELAKSGQSLIASIAGAEGNEFARVASLFLEASGSQTAFGVRTGSIRVGPATGLVRRATNSVLGRLFSFAVLYSDAFSSSSQSNKLDQIKQAIFVWFEIVLKALHPIRRWAEEFGRRVLPLTVKRLLRMVTRVITWFVQALFRVARLMLRPLAFSVGVILRLLRRSMIVVQRKQTEIARRVYARVESGLIEQAGTSGALMALARKFKG